MWRTYTDPKLIPEWWGPRFLKTTVDRMDFRNGGSWRFIHEDVTKKVFGFSGEYREIVEGKRIILTFVFEAFRDSVMVQTTTFEDLPRGQTRVTQVSRFPSLEALEGMVGTGMEQGSIESWDRLAECFRRKLRWNYNEKNNSWNRHHCRRSNRSA